jgi:hypothetical protein
MELSPGGDGVDDLLYLVSQKKRRVINQMARAVVMDSRGFQRVTVWPVALVAGAQGWFPVRR